MPNLNRTVTLALKGNLTDIRAALGWVKSSVDDQKQNSTIPITGDNKGISKTLDETRAKVAGLAEAAKNIPLGVDDKAAKAELAKFTYQLDALDRKVSQPRVSVGGVLKAQADLASLELGLDKLSSRNATPSINPSGGGGGGGESALASPGLIGGAVALGSTLLPTLLPLVIGIGTSLGGAFAAALVNKGFKATLLKQVPLFESILRTATQPLVSMVDFLLPGIDAWAREMEGPLQDAFQASMPFLTMFTVLVEQSAKILLPAFTTSMKQLTPYIPQLTSALVELVTGLAQLVIMLGPSIGTSVSLFTGSMKVMQVALNVFAVYVNLVTQIVHLAFDLMGTVAKIFAGLFTGNLAASGRAAVQFGHDVEVAFNVMKTVVNQALKNIGLAAFDHNVASTFDDVRHWVAMAMDAMVSAVSLAFGKILSFARSWPNLLLKAIGNLEGLLVQVGKDLITGFWNGMKSVWTSGPFAWLKSLAGIISKIKGPLSADGQLLVPHGRAIMTGFLKGLTHGWGGVGGFLTGVAGKVGSFFSNIFGSSGGGVSQWAGTVLQALAMNGEPGALLGQVLHQISTESGGNAAAINLSDINAQMGDPSRGLLQVIGSTFAAFHVPGTSNNIYDPLANVAAAINYAKHVYGPSLMSGGMGLGSGHGYAMGTPSASYGWAMVGERGPELVKMRGGEAIGPVLAGSGSGGHGGYTVNVYASPLANPADVGREVVNSIKQFERGSGSGWRR